MTTRTPMLFRSRDELRSTGPCRRLTQRLAGTALLLAVSLSTFAAAAQTSASTPAQQASQPQQSLQQQQLINRAEAAYKSGLDNYNANRLDAARMDFDFAVDTMLSSGMDLKNDPVLSEEFERLIAAINSLEMDALKQGNGFSPRIEAAPDENAEDVTFAVDPALLGRIASEAKTTVSDLPLPVNEYVAGWINAYSNNSARRAHLVASLKRAGKYKEMIQRILRENGVPQDLIYQAITESGFQPQVLNRSSGAGGMWQFMPFGNYGLQRNGYFDERFDPQKSTVAYAKYMKTLYGMFGDWYLAMAAYDWGPARVQHVVSRTGYASYWDIYQHGNLPAETKAYIPSVIAAIIMAKNPEKYGLTDLTPDAPVLFDTVSTNYAIDMKLVADVTGATVPEIVALNPALLRLSTPRDLPYDLHLPPGTTAVYNERLKDIPEDKRTTWRFHIVHTGETLDSISASLHARSSEVAEYNDVTSAKPLEVDDELVVPVAGASSTALAQQRYTLRRGDSLVEVADRFGVTVEQLRQWNNLRSSSVRPGRSLYVAEPVRLAPGMRASRGRGARSGKGRSRSSSAARSTRGSRGGSSRPSSRTSSRPSSARGHSTAARGSSRSSATLRRKRR